MIQSQVLERDKTRDDFQQFDANVSDVDIESVSLVIPIFNEIESLDALFEKLDQLLEYASHLFDLDIVLVDDGSTDGTVEALQESVDQLRKTRVVLHPENRGIAAAIHTGIQNARHEKVVSIDADGSYDLELIEEMVPLLDDDVDMVTASPYHPQGHVENVSGWRLMISRSASMVYRQLMKQKLHCCTSCYRVYRRSKVRDLALLNEGFVGIAEMIWRLDRQGGRIVEHPAVLRTRSAGKSKMKIFSATKEHLKFIGRVVFGLAG